MKIPSRILFTAAIFAATPLHAQNAVPDAPVTEAELHADIAALSDDAMLGRLPGTAGETLAAQYIARAFAAAGFVGGADASGGWYQPVPLVTLNYVDDLTLVRDRRGRLVEGLHIINRAPAGGRVELDDVPLIFVGHGVGADGSVTGDVRGKIAIMVTDDRPGEHPLSADQRRAALAAAGAVGIWSVPPARFPFAAIQRQYRGGRMQLAARILPVRVEGVIDRPTLDRLLGLSGRNATSLLSQLAAEDFAAVDLVTRADVQVTSLRRDFNSYNVIARRPGRHRDAGAVLITGHWDHLGECRPAGAEDRICNGAVDNASGIATMIAVARRLGQGAPMDRDVVLIATTAEEQGLLGAYHYAAHPTVPLNKITIALNIDTVAIAQRGAPMAIVGRGANPYDAEIDGVARALGRAVDSDLDANAFIRRQDGWALGAAGVPSIMAGGSFSDMAPLETYLEGPYHAPDDELTDAVPLGGAADDGDLHIALARHFANLATHPASNSAE